MLRFAAWKIIILDNKKTKKVKSPSPVSPLKKTVHMQQAH